MFQDNAGQRLTEQDPHSPGGPVVYMPEFATATIPGVRTDPRSVPDLQLDA